MGLLAGVATGVVRAGRAASRTLGLGVDRLEYAGDGGLRRVASSALPLVLRATGAVPGTVNRAGRGGHWTMVGAVQEIGSRSCCRGADFAAGRGATPLAEPRGSRAAESTPAAGGGGCQGAAGGQDHYLPARGRVVGCRHAARGHRRRAGSRCDRLLLRPAHGGLPGTVAAGGGTGTGAGRHLLGCARLCPRLPGVDGGQPTLHLSHLGGRMVPTGLPARGALRRRTFLG